MEDEDAERDEKLDTEVAQLCTKSVTVVTKYNGKPTTNTGQQASLWSRKDQQEVNEYNYGFGYGYGYNSFRDVDTDIDTSLVPDDKIKPIHDLIEECQDKVTDGNCTYEEFLQIRKQINESIEKYNLKIKLFTQNELESKVYHLWPEDFLENINGGQDLAN